MRDISKIHSAYMKATEYMIRRKMGEKCVLCNSTYVNGVAVQLLEIQIISADPITKDTHTHTAKAQSLIWPYRI